MNQPTITVAAIPSGYIRAGEKLIHEMRQAKPPMTRRPRRLFDPLDLATIRRAAVVWDVLAVLIVGVAVAAVPVVLLLLGVEEK